MVLRLLHRRKRYSDYAPSDRDKSFLNVIRLYHVPKYCWQLRPGTLFWLRYKSYCTVQAMILPSWALVP